MHLHRLSEKVCAGEPCRHKHTLSAVNLRSNQQPRFVPSPFPTGGGVSRTTSPCPIRRISSGDGLPSCKMANPSEPSNTSQGSPPTLAGAGMIPFTACSIHPLNPRCPVKMPKWNPRPPRPHPGSPRSLRSYSLTAPVVNPATIRRWNRRTMRTRGMVTITEAAEISAQGMEKRP